jgi:hypothetical protein
MIDLIGQYLDSRWLVPTVVGLFLNVFFALARGLQADGELTAERRGTYVTVRPERQQHQECP